MSEEYSPVPEGYVRQKRKRKRKVGRPKKEKQPFRDSPSMRQGARWKTITVPEEAWLMLKELSAFYKVSIAQYVYSLTLPAFDHTYQESLRLQKIEENRKKDKEKRHEAQDRTDTPRRTHF